MRSWSLAGSLKGSDFSFAFHKNTLVHTAHTLPCDYAWPKAATLWHDQKEQKRADQLQIKKKKKKHSAHLLTAWDLEGNTHKHLLLFPIWELVTQVHDGFLLWSKLCTGFCTSTELFAVPSLVEKTKKKTPSRFACGEMLVDSMQSVQRRHA